MVDGVHLNVFTIRWQLIFAEITFNRRFQIDLLTDNTKPNDTA